MSLSTDKQFFAEFEFSKETNNYWFPVLINSKSKEEAKGIKNEIASILKEGFGTMKSYSLCTYKKPQYSEALKPYVEAKSRAEILKLNLRNLHLLQIEGNKNIRFNQHIVMVPQNLIMIYAHTTQFHLDNLSLLTTQFHHLDYDKEFLILRIY